MDIAIRKLGNSAGVILPATLLKSLGLSVGQHLEAEEVDGKLMLTPRAKKYALKELLAQCDVKAPPPADMKDWDEMPVVGAESVR